MVPFPCSQSLHPAGLQGLSTLQQLEVLHVPCDDAHAITRLAVQLPHLRSLDLRCCSGSGAHEEAGGQLTLAAATVLTELRLHVCGSAGATVTRLQMPPQLQVMTAGFQQFLKVQAATHDVFCADLLPMPDALLQCKSCKRFVDVQALDVKIRMSNALRAADDIMAVINALPLQVGQHTLYLRSHVANGT